MLNLQLARRQDEKLSVLCLGAHSDDIEIGCGGTILRLLEEFAVTEVHWVVLCADPKRKSEAEESAHHFLAKAKQKTIVVRDFRDGFLPYIGGEVKDFFETLKPAVAPDLILTHCRADLHQDHRLVSELTWNTFREHLVLEYEIPKYDGDLGSPNVFVHLDEATCRRKTQFVADHFESQRVKPWFSRDVLESLMRLRGVESRSPSGFAEAHYGRKLVW